MSKKVSLRTLIIGFFVSLMIILGMTLHFIIGMQIKNLVQLNQENYIDSIIDHSKYDRSIKMNYEQVDMEIRILKNRIIYIIFIFISVTITSFLVIERKYILQPIKKLKNEMKLLSNGGNRNYLNEASNSYSIKEITELSDEFFVISKIIKKRELDLVKSEKVLLTKNDELEGLLKELEAKEALMIQQEKLASIGHLAAGVAHELNNPIGFVYGNYSVLKDYLIIIIKYIDFLKSNRMEQINEFDDIDYILEDIKDILEESEEGLNRVIDIVKNLKDFSRIDLDNRSQFYDLNKGISTTLVVSKNEYKYVADIITELGEIPLIMANGSEINEVILNIIVNAAQAIKVLNRTKLSKIIIRTYCDANYVFCEIEDNGPGIDKKIINKIFDPFFTTKDPGKGTGLGLNIAYNIVVEKHKGALNVESNEGIGSKFIMKLPIKLEVKSNED